MYQVTIKTKCNGKVTYKCSFYSLGLFQSWMEDSHSSGYFVFPGGAVSKDSIDWVKWAELAQPQASRLKPSLEFVDG